MCKFRWVYQTSDVISSFKTKNPRALIDKAPWVITKSTKLADALERLQNSGVSDLIVLDPDTGGVLGLLSDPESSSLKGKWKKKKVEELLDVQAKCHDMCVQTCAARGGCKSHGVFPDGKGGWTCGIQCEDDESTLGQIVDQVAA